MRVSHRALQDIIADPQAWITRERSGGRYIRMGYSGITLLSIYRLHKTNDLADALDYLERAFDRRDLRSQERRAQGRTHLQSYAHWLSSSGVNAVATKLRISLPIGSGIVLGGEISRLDVDNEQTKYTGVLIGTEMAALRAEVRAPLLQRGIALAIYRPEEEIALASQNLDGSNLRELQFDPGDIEEAMSVAERIAHTLASL